MTYYLLMKCQRLDRTSMREQLIEVNCHVIWENMSIRFASIWNGDMNKSVNIQIFGTKTSVA
jgi:hypothetical protein